MADIGGGQMGEVVVATGKKDTPFVSLLLMKVDAAAMIDHDSLGSTQKRKED
jgi:hypothetical protein